jgi:Na+-driven multidrug efflux pump
MTLGIVLGRALDGAGSTVLAMVVSLISLSGIEVGASYLLAGGFDLGAIGIWWGWAMAGLANGLMFAF